jgi:hypothetical protein
MTMNRFKALYGLLLLVILAVLADRIAFGKVEEQTSYGLMPMIVALASALSSYCTWLFGSAAADHHDQHLKPDHAGDKPDDKPPDKVIAVP